MTAKGQQHRASVKVHVTEATRQRLIDLASREDRSVNWLLRRMIDEGLAKAKA